MRVPRGLRGIPSDESPQLIVDLIARLYKDEMLNSATHGHAQTIDVQSKL